MQKLVSFDLKANFGFLKKPDTNEPVSITYNMLHKPALLGIIGAIVGLEGFKVVYTYGRKRKGYIPKYLEAFNDLKVGIQPLDDEKGNFQKTIIRYNNSVGYANKDGGTLIVDEQTLISPSYRCYILFDLDIPIQQLLYDKLKNNEAEYIPYLGKNDFSVWWEHFEEYVDYELFQNVNDPFKISSLFIKERKVKDGVEDSSGFELIPSPGNTFIYFENLPISYDRKLMQYEINSFAFTDWDLKNYKVDNLYRIADDIIVQLF